MKNDKEIINLAKEILVEAKARRGSVESLVLKAHRLAKLVDNQTILTWLNLEKYGYGDKEPDLTYMKATGRTYNETTRIGYWGSMSTQEAAIEANLAEMEVVKNFKPSGNYSTLQFDGQIQRIRSLAAMVSFYRKICSNVVSNIQDFAGNVYYAYLFEKEATSILDEERKKAVNGILKTFPELNKSFEVINKNINSTNPRDWTVIALECRNIFINLSGELWKTSKNEYECKDGDIIKTNTEKNKLIAYIDTKVTGTTVERAKAIRLFKTIHEIFDIAGKSKRGIDRKELSTIVTQTFIVLTDLSTATDLQPVL